MRKLILVVAALFSFSLVHAFSGEFSLDLKNSIYNQNLALPTPVAGKTADKTARKKAVKEWTVMVFVNGKNNLEIAGLFNVNQMEKVGSSRKVNILVELGRMKGQQGDTDIDGDWTGSRRIYIKKDNDEEKVTSPVVMETAQVDMGDYKRAADFVKWAKENYPAKKYMLVLWDHGTGWMDPQMAKKKTSSKGISFDDETGNYIRTKQIAEIVKEAGGVDILAFDACLMQMAEVAYEARDYAKYIIGSEETEPAYGYPYDMFLSVLRRYPRMRPETLARKVVEAHETFYRDIVKKASMLSVIDSSKLEDFAELAGEFADLVRKVDDGRAVQKARKEVIRYDVVGPESDPKKTISFFADLSQFAAILGKNITKTGKDSDKLVNKIAELRKFIGNELIIAHYGTGKERTGKELSVSGGISVYIPPAETRIPQEKLEGIFEAKYEDFAFSKAAKWHDFATYVYNVKTVSENR